MTAKAHIATAGAGRMGRGIAIVFAYGGHPVRLIDFKARGAEEFATFRDRTLREIRSVLDMLAGLDMFGADLAEKIAARVSVHPLAEAGDSLRWAEVVFEGVPETLEAKREALALIGDHARPDTIVSSTTSTILSDELQSMIAHPERFLNAHWLNPAFLVPLVEVSPGSGTAPEVTARLNALLEAVGKVPVVCKPSPGYIVPRIQSLAMNEAARMAEEGVASAEDIDKATRTGLGFRFAILGILEFIDWGGGDTLYYATRYMREATGEERFSVPDIVEKNMQEGRTGLTARRGFLDYSTMDVEEYQRQRLGAFVALLKHLDMLPPPG
jgi:3-hydroxybutyryl-CoA dehydrogenase